MALPGLTRASADKRYTTVFTPERYGAAAAFSSGVDDTAAVQAAINAAQAAGGQFLLRRMYNIPTGGLTITGPVTGRGVGRMLKGGLSPVSGFSTASATATCLTIQASNVHLSNFAVVNTSSTVPTAGYGIFVDTSASFTWGDNVLIDGVDTLAFWTNVYMSAGSYWKYINCYNYGAARIGLRISNANNPDGGDQFIANNAILTDRVATGAAIQWESGGGPKIFGNKINGAGSGSFYYGLQVAPATPSTSVFLFNHNSIENVQSAAIRVFTASGTAFSLIIITANEIANVSSVVGAILIDGGTPALQLKSVRIADNIINCGSGVRWGIWVDGVSTVSIGANVITGSVVGGVYIGPTNSLVDVKPPTMGGTSVLVKDDMTRSNSLNGSVGLVEHHYARGIVATGKVTPTVHWSVVMRDNDSCIAKFTASGLVVGLGAFMIQATRVITRTGGTACVLTTVGTDIQTGFASTDVVYAFDTATVTGEVRATLLLNGSTTGTSLVGKYALSVDGSPNEIKRGAATTPAIT